MKMRKNEGNSVGFPGNSVGWVVPGGFLVEGLRRRVRVGKGQVTLGDHDTHDSDGENPFPT